MATAKETLVSVFNKIENLVKYNPKWENGTGYLDNAMRDVNIEFDEDGYAKAVSTAGRKIVIVKTCKGNAVVFERYTDPESSVVVSNMPSAIEQLFGMNGSLSGEQLKLILGNPEYACVQPNIGRALDVFMAPARIRVMETA